MGVHTKGPPVTINIDIYLSPQDGDMGAQLDEHMKALGFTRGPAAIMVKPLSAETVEALRTEAAKPSEIIVGDTEVQSGGTTTAPTRERGKPSPGRARRTKEEIAEDEAAEKADMLTPEVKLVDQTDTAPAISETPEDRQDPANPEVVDDAEAAAADAADEAAETAAEKAKTGGKLTLDDVRNVIGLYVKAYGMPAAQADGPKIIASVCGEGAVKVSDIPEDKIGDVIEAIKAAGRANTYKREAVVQS